MHRLLLALLSLLAAAAVSAAVLPTAVDPTLPPIRLWSYRSNQWWLPPWERNKQHHTALVIDYRACRQNAVSADAHRALFQIAALDRPNKAGIDYGDTHHTRNMVILIELVPDAQMRQIFKLLEPYTSDANWRAAIDDYNLSWRMFHDKWADEPIREPLSVDVVKETEIPPPLDLAKLELGRTSESSKIIQSMRLGHSFFRAPQSDAAEAL